MESFLFKELFYVWLGGFITHFLRYVIIAGLAYIIFYIWKRSYFESQKIQKDLPKQKNLRTEFLYSVSTFLIFGAVGILVFLLKKHGYTLIYDKIDKYGLIYMIMSVFLSLIIHDTYFYWTHRLMHWKFLFPLFHKIHHLSFNPSPWASFSFHPLEAIVEAAIVPLLVFILPLHPIAILLFLLIMTIMNVMGHLGYELYPSGFLKSRIGKWNNTSTHHNMHHRFGKSNYGLYFNWWDRIMKTNHPNYELEFEKNAPERKVQYVAEKAEPRRVL